MAASLRVHVGTVYRAIEDIARASSGRAGDIRPRDWRSLHEHLGTTEAEFRSRIAALQSARKAAAHGDASALDLIEARGNGAAILATVREIVAEAIERDGTLPLGVSDFRFSARPG